MHWDMRVMKDCHCVVPGSARRYDIPQSRDAPDKRYLGSAHWSSARSDTKDEQTNNKIWVKGVGRSELAGVRCGDSIEDKDIDLRTGQDHGERLQLWTIRSLTNRLTDTLTPAPRPSDWTRPWGKASTVEFMESDQQVDPCSSRNSVPSNIFFVKLCLYTDQEQAPVNPFIPGHMTGNVISGLRSSDSARQLGEDLRLCTMSAKTLEPSVVVVCIFDA
ncbi:hypothetical protein RRG08_022382 [Elysia crispata]|uniref:Uncharacterized protein n=1 Tax=Elysia crispata TaxID=231223 RepID=A0AAE0Z1P7_9GAST|nr:hypothetical protein RRG08_022382 [Elysia crispata]